jgi:Family of unknown function (DUF6535)
MLRLLVSIRKIRLKVCISAPRIAVFPPTSFTHLPPGLPDSVDPASRLWALCISQADKHDTAMAKSWKTDMDGILLYVCIQTVDFNHPAHLAESVFRRVYSPRQLLHSSLKATSYSSLILLRYPQDFFARLQTNLLQSPMELTHPLRRPMNRFNPNAMPSM